MGKYAQLDQSGRVVAVTKSAGDIDHPNIVPAPISGDVLGMVWTGAEFVARSKTEKEAAAADLVDVDTKTGMPRTMREALIAIADKVGADVAYLKAEEARAAAARLKIKG